ncbi:hypothetical protein [Endozoicomonas sp. Mp262]|uniref:hypothetical protein n=1 Tax=Endozoicomonas sp. Mp262 TaxID=2919499 RepID=UPI0021D9E6DF
MSGPVDNGGILPSGKNTPIPANSDMPGVASGEKVSIGYATATTSEVVAGVASESGEGDLPNLDPPPAESSLTGQNFTEFAVKTSLSGIQAAIKQFSNIDVAALDVADTASILLLIKGAVSDMKTMAGAESIDAALGSLLTKYDGQIERARDVIFQRMDLADKFALWNQKTDLRSEKQVLLEQKQQELQGADAGGDNSALEAAIAQLQQEIAQLDTEIDELDVGINTLRGLISTNEKQLSVELQSDLNRIFAVTEGVKQRFDSSALRTGEDERAKRSVENHELSLENAKDRQRLREEKKELSELGKEQIRNQHKRDDELESEQRLALELNRFGINVPDEVLALFGTADLEDVQAFTEKVLNDLPVDQLTDKLSEAMSRFETVFTDLLREAATADEGKPGATVQAADSRLSRTLSELLPELDENERDRVAINLAASRQEDVITESARASQRLALLQAVEALESQALAMVAESEKERERTEGEISRHSRA